MSKGNKFLQIIFLFTEIHFQCGENVWELIRNVRFFKGKISNKTDLIFTFKLSREWTKNR